MCRLLLRGQMMKRQKQTPHSEQTGQNGRRLWTSQIYCSTAAMQLNVWWPKHRRALFRFSFSPQARGVSLAGKKIFSQGSILPSAEALAQLNPPCCSFLHCACFSPTSAFHLLIAADFPFQGPLLLLPMCAICCCVLYLVSGVWLPQLEDRFLPLCARRKWRLWEQTDNIGTCCGTWFLEPSNACNSASASPAGCLAHSPTASLCSSHSAPGAPRCFPRRFDTCIPAFLCVSFENCPFYWPIDDFLSIFTFSLSCSELVIGSSRLFRQASQIPGTS